MGAKFYLDCAILLTKADQVRFCTVRIQGLWGHLQRSTPRVAPSPKVSQNPFKSESYRQKPVGFPLDRFSRYVAHFVTNRCHIPK
jgi:hypothetical protein